MSDIPPLIESLAPDCISRLERAAKARFDDADDLRSKRRILPAIYLYGFCVEMCLTAAFFRSAGFHENDPIGRDTRRRRMAQARQLQTERGEPLMNSDPHPLVGWARFLEWHRKASDLTKPESQRLTEAIHMAEQIYKHWRPELRYKMKDVKPDQLREVRQAAAWFLEYRGSQ